MVLVSYDIVPKVWAIFGFGIGPKSQIVVSVVHYFIVDKIGGVS